MNSKNKNPEFISGMDANKYNLIPVHINKMRNEEYFYSWSSDAKGYFRGEKIPENLNRGYKNPPTKSNYK